MPLKKSFSVLPGPSTYVCPKLLCRNLDPQQGLTACICLWESRPINQLRSLPPKEILERLALKLLCRTLHTQQGLTVCIC
jgi:hypothetical protein